MSSDTHDHHGHAHGAPANYGRAFAIGITLNLAFVFAEAFYGVMADSMALIADAGHNLSDVLGLVLAWGASILARRVPSATFTYGLRGSTILAALANGVLLLVVTGGIAWEAIQRFFNPPDVAGPTVIIVALVGVAINLATALLFMSGRKNDLNLRGAFLHMAGDAAVSLGVAITGVLVIYTGWAWLDPAASLMIVAVIIIGSLGLLRDAGALALHAVPEKVDAQAVRSFVESLPGVVAIHDLHIWGMSTTETALTVHLVMPGGHPGDGYLADLCHRLSHDFHIAHSTVQIELGDAAHPCALEPAHCV